MDFKRILAQWFSLNQRNLPWRNTTNPYHIWVSEVVLQQTRVVQGIGYYHRFIDEFPTVFHLAHATDDEVLKVWQGLGYYTRARNMHLAAKRIVDECNGIIPNTFEQLLGVKGLGHYSAGAIASFAFKEAVPAMDGNVYRVLSRIYGLFASPFTVKGRREFHNLVMDLMDMNKPDSFNQALLDFGALQCKPRGPMCHNCPFAMYCYAFRNNIIDSLPVKAKKTEPRSRYFTYIIIRYNEDTFIAKRKGNDIWHSLYEFPLIETDTQADPLQILKHPKWKLLFERRKVEILHTSNTIKHQLSHQTIMCTFIIVRIRSITKALSTEFVRVNSASLSHYSTPRLIDSFIAAEPAAKYLTSKQKPQ
jgi:A/G-specific adenine glycosylase